MAHTSADSDQTDRMEKKKGETEEARRSGTSEAAHAQHLQISPYSEVRADARSLGASHRDGGSSTDGQQDFSR